jgi:hypothetical protein
MIRKWRLFCALGGRSARKNGRPKAALKSHCVATIELGPVPVAAVPALVSVLLELIV